MHIIPSLSNYKSWIHPSEISYHYPICLEWNFAPHCHLYPFKFIRDWLLEKDFSDIVYTSWNTQIHPPLDLMSTLTFKLKRLEETIKAWEKNMKQTKAKEAREVDLAIQLLLTSHTSAILSVNEAT